MTNVKLLMIMLFSLVFASAAFGSGGKNRLGDDLIDEVYQLCQQAGIDTGTIEVEDCTSDRCIVVKVDCSVGVPGDDE